MARNYEWQAPAKLFFWPGHEGAEEETVYASLSDAVRAAWEGDLLSAWIITQDGDILNPRMIRALHEEMAESRKARRRSFNPFARLRAAEGRAA